MIIGKKEVQVSENEFKYYEYLSEKLSDKEKNIVGADYFNDLFEVDTNGFIVQIKPEKSVPWAVIFFVQQVMINQRLRMLEGLGDKISKDLNNKDKIIKKLTNKIEELSAKVDSLE